MARVKQMQNKNNNVFCYYRYSSHAQRDESIEQQQKEAYKYCASKGYKIIREFEDRAVSGTIYEREGLQQMLIEAKRERPHALIVWKTDRLSRDRFDSVRIKDELNKYGVKVEYIAEPMPEDDATRLIIESLNEALAQHFIEQHIKNVTRGMRQNAEKCLYNGHKILGYKGVSQHPYIVDEVTSQIVVKIFNDYAQGKTMRGIANELNDAGITTAQGGEFTEKTIWRILHNRSYIGEYKFGDIIIADGMPRLISDELYNTVQNMMQENKHNGRGEAKKVNKLRGIDFWLTGYLYCGICGKGMHGTSGTGKGGDLHYYYTCVGKRNKKCDKKSVRKELVEKIVIQILRECLNDTAIKLLISLEVYKYCQREYGADESYIKSLRAQIKDVEKKLSNIMSAIEAGIFNDTTQARMFELNEQKKRLNDELELQENIEKYSLKQEDVIRYLEAFTDFDNKEIRGLLLDCLIEKIYLYDDKIVIDFFYSEDNREISFDDFSKQMELYEQLGSKSIMDNVGSSSVSSGPLKGSSQDELGTSFFCAK